MNRRRLHAAVTVSLVALCVVASTDAGLQAQERKTLPPTTFEAFVARPNSVTTWSKSVGRLDGGTAFAEVSAVVVEAVSATPERMRGIRLDMRHLGAPNSCGLIYEEWAAMCARADAAVYIEEAQLASFKAAVLKGRAEVHPGHPMGVTTFRASGGAFGILVFGYGLHGRTLDEIVALVSSAEAALADAPR